MKGGVYRMLTLYLANPHGLRWPTEIFLLWEKRISVARFVRLPLSLSWCGKINPVKVFKDRKQGNKKVNLKR